MVQAENSKCKAPEVGTRNSIRELEEQKEAPGGYRAASQRGRVWGRLGRSELPAACLLAREALVLLKQLACWSRMCSVQTPSCVTSGRSLNTSSLCFLICKMGLIIVFFSQSL